MTARERIAIAPAPQVHVLDEIKARRLRGRTMLMPSPAQFGEVVAQIPYGESRTLLEVRQILAARADAEITCPMAATKCWSLVAEASEEARRDGDPNPVPWWRVTRDGKPDHRMPGGIEGHRARLSEEMPPARDT